MIHNSRFKVCSAVRPKKDVEVGSEFYPRNCTEESSPGSAFCEDCAEQIRALGKGSFITYSTTLPL